MPPLEPPFCHYATLEAPPLLLEIYSEDDPVVLQNRLGRIGGWLVPLWEGFYSLAQEAKLLANLGLKNHGQSWAIELHWVNNPSIQHLNQEYRGKDQPTDVLTFTLFADALPQQRTMFAQLPEVHLGAIFISLQWAENLAADYPNANNIKHSEGCFSNFIHVDGFNVLEAYILERVVHGWLHLLGVTHETEARYNQVIQWQHDVLGALRNRVFDASAASHSTGISSQAEPGSPFVV